MTYQNIHHLDAPVTVRHGHAAISLKCQCSKRCRTKIHEGDEVFVVAITNPMNRWDTRKIFICSDHFNKNYREMES